MCGIVGLYAKSDGVRQSLGEHVSSMLVQMGERGPDSAGVAIYRDSASAAHAKAQDANAFAKLTVQHDNKSMLFDFSTAIQQAFDNVTVHSRGTHLVLESLPGFPKHIHICEL